MKISSKPFTSSFLFPPPSDLLPLLLLLLLLLLHHSQPTLSQELDFIHHKEPVSPESQRAILDYKRRECEERIKKEELGKEMKERMEEEEEDEEKLHKDEGRRRGGEKFNNRNDFEKKHLDPFEENQVLDLYKQTHEEEKNSYLRKTLEEGSKVKSDISDANKLSNIFENNFLNFTSDDTISIHKVLEIKEQNVSYLNILVGETSSRLSKLEMLPDISEKSNGSSSRYCPTTFDDVYCWPKSPAGALVEIPCPSYVQGFYNEGKATRYCTPNGSWFILPGRNSSWTNYTDCQLTFLSQEVNEKLLQWAPKIRSMATVGYGVSLVTLLVALTLLISFKNLHCPRNSLHMHLFVSFACRAACAICRDQVGVMSNSTHRNSHEFIKCRAFTCVWQYCILANYFWILMEGLYLHNIVFLAIFNDNSSILTYVLRGWGFPFILVVLWSVARVVEENTLCWTTNNNSIIFWVFIRGPISISIVVSFALFMKITRELFLKIRSKSTFGGPKHSYRRWARSTLVLVPLFGVHYAALLGFGYSMGKHSTIELVWLFTDQFFASLQGFFVATLYCLLNVEVRNEIKKFWRKWKPNKPIFKASSFRYPAGFGPKRLVSRLNIRNGDSVKPKVALINSFEMTTYKNDFQETCLNVEEDFEKSLNRANVFNNKNNCEASTHSLGKHFSNEGKDRSYSVETCVLHVSSSSDLQETCLPLISADVEHRPTDHINFPYKDYRSSSMGNFMFENRDENNVNFTQQQLSELMKKKSLTKAHIIQDSRTSI